MSSIGSPSNTESSRITHEVCSDGTKYTYHWKDNEPQPMLVECFSAKGQLVWRNPPRGEGPKFILPELPASAAKFDRFDFGGYRSNGYDPCFTTGSVTNFPIALLKDPQNHWLDADKVGSAGSVIHLKTKDNYYLGHITLPSSATLRETKCLELRFVPQLEEVKLTAKLTRKF